MKLLHDWAFRLTHFVRRSFYRKLLLSFCAIITITVSLIGLDNYYQTSRNIKRQTIENMERMSEQSESTISNYMNSVKSFAWNYFGDPRFQQFVIHMGSDPESISYYQNELNEFVRSNSFAGAIRVNQLDGFSLKSGTAAYYSSEMEKEMRRLHNIALGNDGKGEWTVSAGFDPMSGKFQPTLAFVQALKEIKLTSRPIIGVLIIQLSPDMFDNLLEGLGSGGEGNAYLLRRDDGIVDISMKKEAIGTRILDPDSLRMMNNTNEARHIYASINGKQSLVVYHQLKKSRWILVSEVPLDILLKQVREPFQRTILIGALALFGSMLLAGLLSSKVTVPLKRLREGIKSVEYGNFHTEVPVETTDEFGFLSRGFNRMTREIRGLIVQAYESELVKKDAEIRALQSQVNPHFLYNTLGTIESLAMAHDDKRIGEICRSLARMFRYNISGGRESTLHAEMQQIEMYLKIQKIRYGDRLDFSTYLEPGLEALTTPKLLIQPLVENAILHGIDPLIQGGVIRIEAASARDGDVEIRVWNNGSTIAPEKIEKMRADLEMAGKNGDALEKSASIGLTNVQARLRMVYGEGCGISIESSPELGTVFTIVLQKLFHGEEESA